MSLSPVMTPPAVQFAGFGKKKDKKKEQPASPQQQKAQDEFVRKENEKKGLFKKIMLSDAIDPIPVVGDVASTYKNLSLIRKAKKLGIPTKERRKMWAWTLVDAAPDLLIPAMVAVGVLAPPEQGATVLMMMIDLAIRSGHKNRHILYDSVVDEINRRDQQQKNQKPQPPEN